LAAKEKHVVGMSSGSQATGKEKPPVVGDIVWRKSMKEQHDYKTGDLVVCLTGQYDNVKQWSIGIVTHIPYSFALVNCDFNGVRGSFPLHQIQLFEDYYTPEFLETLEKAHANR
jgi:hypothetical protein